MFVVVKRYVHPRTVVMVMVSLILFGLLHKFGWDRRAISALVCGPCDVFTARAPLTPGAEPANDVTGMEMLGLVAVLSAFILAMIQMSTLNNKLYIIQIIVYFVAGGCLLATVLLYSPGSSLSSLLESSVLLVLLITTASMVAAGLNFIEYNKYTEEPEMLTHKEPQQQWS